jgi:hypothetical protein
MRITVFLILITSLYSFAQDIVIYSKGKEVKTKVVATSSTTLHTNNGTFKYLDIDSVHTTDQSLMDKIYQAQKNRPSVITYQSLDKRYVDDLPYDETGILIFTEVVDQTASKNDLYLRGKMFFAKAFKSANDVIQLDDKESGTTVGKGLSEIYVFNGMMDMKIQLHYTIKIQSKDNRYKYSIDGFYFKTYPSQYASSSEYPADHMFLKANYFKNNGNPRSINSSYKEKLLAEAIMLVNSIKNIMSDSKTTATDKDDW